MSVKLYKCKDYYDNDYKETRLGFDWEGFFITDPTTSECGRFHIPRYDIAKTYGLTEKQIEKIICVACGEVIGIHSRRQLARCLFRIQGTFVSNGIENPQPSEKE